MRVMIRMGRTGVDFAEGSRGARALSWTSACAGAAVVGAAVVRLPSVAVGLAGSSLLFVLAFVRLPILVSGLVLAAFASRLSIDVAGIHVRPEHFATILLLVALSMRGRGGEFLKQAFRAPSIYLLLYVVYSAAISILFSESFARSATILSWLLLDWVLLASLLASKPSRGVIYNALAWGSGLAAVLAIALWLSAPTAGESFGVQRALGESAPAAYGLSFEANILAGALLLSALALFSAPRQYLRRWHTFAGILAVAALPVTQTRAAILGMAAGLIVLLFRSRDRLIRRRVWRTMAVVGLSVGGLSIAGWQGSQAVLGKFADSLDFFSGNGGYRLTVARLALSDMHNAQSWVFGLGTNSFSQRHLDFSRPGAGVDAYLGSLPLQIIYDSGVVGVCIILLLAVQLLYRSRFSGSSVSVMLAFVIIATSTSPFWFASTWIFAALAVLPRDPDPATDPPERVKELALNEPTAAAGSWTLPMGTTPRRHTMAIRPGRWGGEEDAEVTPK